MKKNYLLVFGLLLFVLEYASAALPEFNSGRYYYIAFGRGTNLVVQDTGEGELLKAQTFIPEESSQLWKFDGTQESFTLTSKAERVVCYKTGSAGSTQFETVTPGSGVTADVFKIETQGTLFVIKRVAETEIKAYFNPSGGSTVGNNVQLWDKDDGGSLLDFAILPELSTNGDEHWYYIKSTRSDTGGKVMQNNGDNNATTVTLEECNSAQYWKFAGTSYADGFKVVGYDEKELYLTSTTSDNGNVRTKEEGHVFKFSPLALYAAYYLSLEGTVKTWGPAADRVLEFTPVTTHSVTVTAGDNVSDVRVTAPVAGDAGSSPFQIPCNGKITITYKVDDDCVPTVIVGAVTHPIGEPSGDDTYTVTVANITEATTITIAAEAASYEVTVSVSDEAGISITSPDLNDGKYMSSASSTIFFTLLAGRENVEVTVPEGVTKSLSNEGSDYTLALSGINSNITVTITVSKIKQTVSIVASTGVNVTNAENYPKEVDYNTYEQFYFTLADGYHSPIVRINGNNQACSPNPSTGAYTFGLSVKANTTIQIQAFPANVLPVAADTYVAGGGNGQEKSNNYSSSTELYVERDGNGSGNWNRLAYLWFNATDAIKNAGYNRVKLRLFGIYIEPKPSDGTMSLHMEVRNVTDAVLTDAMTWNSNVETGTPKGATIPNADKIVQLSSENISGKEFVLDITDEDILSKIASGEQVLLLLNALFPDDTYSNGHIRFHSGENTVNPAFVPQLIFEKVAMPDVGVTVNVSTYADYHGDIVFHSNDTGTGQLTGTGEFTPIGKVKLVKTFTTDQWYPIGFPFEIDNNNITIKYGTETTMQGVIYDGNTGDHEFTQPGGDGTKGNFFVKEYKAESNYFVFTDAIAANTGYIVEFPAGEFESSTEVEVTFVSTESPTLTIGATGADIPGENTNLSLVVNSNVSNITGIGNAMDYYQYDYDPSNPLFTRLSQASLANALKPFEAIVAVKTGTDESAFRSAIGDGSGGFTALEALPGLEELQEVLYYTLQGVRIYSPQVNGVYIVKKIYASGKTDISKIIYKNKE